MDTIYSTKNSNRNFIILNNISWNNVEIKFLDNGSVYKTSMFDIINGLEDPDMIHPLLFKNKGLEMLHTVVTNKFNEKIYIDKYIDANHVEFYFLDHPEYIYTNSIHNIRKGEFMNPFRINKYGGYIGVGEYTKNNQELMVIWRDILRYGYKYIVDNSWLCFNNFAKWYYDRTVILNREIKYDINKDILFNIYKSKTNNMKKYGPDTCVIIPHELSLIIRNKNKYNKDIIKEKIEFYLSINALDPILYNYILLYLGGEYY